jgi:hypothetical protein
VRPRADTLCGVARVPQDSPALNNRTVRPVSDQIRTDVS